MKSLKSVQFVYLRHFSLMFKVFRHNGRQHIYFNCFYGFVSPTEDPLGFFLQYYGVLSISTPFLQFYLIIIYHFLFSDSVSASF